jgi:hypothetical protein
VALTFQSEAQWLESLRHRDRAELRDELRHLENQANAILEARPNLRDRVRQTLLQYEGPLERRLHSVVHKIDAIGEELIARGEALDSISGLPAQIIAQPPQQATATSRPRRRGPDIVKRAEIVRQNPEARAQGLCLIFDNEKIPVPKGWATQRWTQAYKSPVYRKLIHTIVWKDRMKPA